MKKFVLGLFVWALLFTGCDRRERLYIYNWAYFIPLSILEQFEQEFNVRIVLDEYASNEEMFAKLMTIGARGRMYDLVFPSEDFVPIMIREGMLAELDHSLIPNLRYINPMVTDMMFYDPGMNYSVPYAIGAAAIIVNTEMVPDYEESWNIFAREDLRGRMTLLDDLRETIGGALIYLGYSVNTTNPGEIDEAVELILSDWAPNLLAFDAGSFGRVYASGDAWVVHGWPETVFEEIDGDDELIAKTAFFFPHEGITGYVDNMVILQRGSNQKMAHEFINFIHRPDIYAIFLDEFRYPTAINLYAVEHMEREPLYSAEDIYGAELKDGLGEDISLYTRAWFDRIRIGN